MASVDVKPPCFLPDCCVLACRELAKFCTYLRYTVLRFTGRDINYKLRPFILPLSRRRCRSFDADVLVVVVVEIYFVAPMNIFSWEVGLVSSRKTNCSGVTLPILMNPYCTRDLYKHFAKSSREECFLLGWLVFVTALCLFAPPPHPSSPPWNL